jgi:hypothetical protein
MLTDMGCDLVPRCRLAAIPKTPILRNTTAKQGIESVSKKEFFISTPYCPTFVIPSYVVIISPTHTLSHQPHCSVIMKSLRNETNIVGFQTHTHFSSPFGYCGEDMFLSAIGTFQLHGEIN